MEQNIRGTSHDIARSLVQTSDGGYALAGGTWSYGAGLYDFWLVKTRVESGSAWTHSTADAVTLYRGATDAYWNYVRVRILRIEEKPTISQKLLGLEEFKTSKLS